MTHYRYCVIGAGIVGLSTAYHLLLDEPDATVVVLEAEDAVATHQTGHNSGVIHSGIYYEPGSLKARFCKAGERATKDFCTEHGIAFDECGKLIVATDPSRSSAWPRCRSGPRSTASTCRPVSRDELGELEPNVTGSGGAASAEDRHRRLPPGLRDARRADPSAPVASCGPGARRRDRRNAAGVSVTTEPTPSPATGWWCAVVCRPTGSPRWRACAIDVQIVPFRGEYFRLPAERAGFVNRLIYPVPDPDLPFLGVHLSPTINGDITVGPSAMLGLAREGYPRFSVDPRDVARMAAFPGTWRVAAANIAFGAQGDSATRCSSAAICASAASTRRR